MHDVAAPVGINVSPTTPPPRRGKKLVYNRLAPYKLPTVARP